MAKKDEIVVRFVKPMAPYREGDCACFDYRLGNRIVAQGFAEEIDLEDTIREENE